MGGAGEGVRMSYGFIRWGEGQTSADLSAAEMEHPIDLDPKFGSASLNRAAPSFSGAFRLILKAENVCGKVAPQTQVSFIDNYCPTGVYNLANYTQKVCRPRGRQT